VRRMSTGPRGTSESDERRCAERRTRMSEVREQISRFGDAFGWPWVPVRFCPRAPEGEARELRFCEAVREGVRSPVVLTAASVGCPGAKRSFGWARGLDEGLAEELAKKQSVPLGTAKKMIRGVPRLDDGAYACEVGTRDKPDVLVSYAQAPTAMKIARAIEKTSGEPLRPVLSSVMSACGNAVVRSFVSGDVALSFGCDQSRESGAIGRDRLIIGVPWAQVGRLLDTIQ
jgi:uncharacterized protein (DUF169 family)